jgi:hypothetical protein
MKDDVKSEEKYTEKSVGLALVLSWSAVAIASRLPEIIHAVRWW